MSADQAPSNPARRRLTRGGLAAPVVLASLASRNAFAAVPYSCTVSGKLSGNTSPFGPNQDPNASCSLRSGRSSVLSELKDNETTFASAGFSVAYFANGNNQKATKLSGMPFQNEKKSQPATLYQVLNLTDYTGGGKAPQEPEFAKMAVVLYQNALADTSDVYPLSKPQVVAMFNAAVANKDYDGITSMGAFVWKPREVRDYFQQLYY